MDASLAAFAREIALAEEGATDGVGTSNKDLFTGVGAQSLGSQGGEEGLKTSLNRVIFGERITRAVKFDGSEGESLSITN